MPYLNKVMLMGNVTRDPRVKLIPNDVLVAEFGLAVSRKFKYGDDEREDVAFVDCTAFGKQAELVQRFITKGRPLFVEGRLKYETWEGRGGDRRSKLAVVVENLQFISPRDAEHEGPRPWRPEPVLFDPPARQERPASAAQSAPAEEDNAPDAPSTPPPAAGVAAEPQPSKLRAGKGQVVRARVITIGDKDNIPF